VTVVYVSFKLVGSTSDSENVPSTIIHRLFTRHRQPLHLTTASANTASAFTTAMSVSGHHRSNTRRISTKQPDKEALLGRSYF